ncbi:hypothetical protein KCP91_12240 [Microvirga sp. SRT01]|uniref:Uncharacterized protein n=1 Tax=Sphingomonas longa TaxID=2778730 RepID=A0ABS2D9E4_9SPHN|nr:MULTISPECIES: hypothetical protein [Alphaproteobacteria]MBM6577143.1 hypothetical protein [Sphingomonas sp. BT552]MBR7710187.1 hypothetical protein [Microvirga sp. SRT01]
MKYELNINDLIEEVQEHLDTDCRYFDATSGYFPWASEQVAFVKLPDEFELTYKGETFRCVRF